MPGGFPLGLELCNATDQGTNLATSVGVTLTASASTNTMGAYSQIVASSSIDACWVVLMIDNNPSSGRNFAIDLATGGAGNEVVIASQLVNSWDSHTSYGYYSFPCNIPAGTRIAARCQSVTSSDSIIVTVMLFDGAFTQMDGAAGIDPIGFTAASTQGTTIDPGAVINTKGAYAQLTASSAKDYMGFLFALDTLGVIGSGANPSLLDIAIGGAGSESIIVPNFAVLRPQDNMPMPCPSPFFPIPIPAGTRIAARAQTTVNTAGTRTFGLTLYGVYQ